MSWWKVMAIVDRLTFLFVAIDAGLFVAVVIGVSYLVMAHG